MLKRNVLYVILTAVTVLMYGQEKDDIVKDELLYTPEIGVSMGSACTFEDRDNSSKTNFTIDANTPELFAEMDGFVKMYRSLNPSLYVGPFMHVEGNLGFRIDRKNDQIRPDVFTGYGVAGIRGGYEFQSKTLEGSYLEFYIPASFLYRVNEDDSLNVAPAGVSENEFYTFFYAGTGAGLDFALKLKKYYTAIDIADDFIIAFEPENSLHDREYNLFVRNVFSIKAENAPFNFISKKVNVYFGISERITVEQDYFGLYIQNRFTAGLFYRPVKGFELGIQPVRYYYSVNSDNVTDKLYDQRTRLEAQVSAELSHKNLSLELSVTPVYWALKREKVNTDDIKTVTVAVEAGFEF